MILGVNGCDPVALLDRLCVTVVLKLIHTQSICQSYRPEWERLPVSLQIEEQCTGTQRRSRHFLLEVRVCMPACMCVSSACGMHQLGGEYNEGCVPRREAAGRDTWDPFHRKRKKRRERIK